MFKEYRVYKHIHLKKRISMFQYQYILCLHKWFTSEPTGIEAPFNNDRPSS